MDILSHFVSVSILGTENLHHESRVDGITKGIAKEDIVADKTKVEVGEGFCNYVYLTMYSQKSSLCPHGL